MRTIIHIGSIIICLFVIHLFIGIFSEGISYNEYNSFGWVCYILASLSAVFVGLLIAKQIENNL